MSRSGQQIRTFVPPNGAGNLRPQPESVPDQNVGSALRRWASAQVRHALQTQPFGHFAQALPTRREEPPQQAALAQFFQPRLPGLGGRANPFEDVGDFTRDCRLARAEEPPGVFDQQEEHVQPRS